MHLHVYLITLATDTEDARLEAETWIGHHNGEFFDYGSVEDPGRVVLVSSIRKELEEGRAEAEKRLPVIERQIGMFKASGDRDMEGYCHKRYARILQEDTCEDMPYFNIENWDWSLPTEVPEKANGRDWYAVWVDLHY